MRGTYGIAALAGLALAALALAGCGDQKAATATKATKAGGSSEPVTLRIGTDDSQGKPAADQIEEFARQVDALSGGTLRIQPVWHAAGDGSDWDQRVARMVSGGELELGMIPSRTWDTEGVTSLRALNAPFLVTSDALVQEVVTGDLSAELLSGLDADGVVGLSLIPEGLRHPFGLGRLLLGPGDYAGQAIRTPTSATVEAMFSAFGATTNDEVPSADMHAGMESSYPLAEVGTATANVTFFPKVNTLVANDAAYRALDDGQRTILQQAADATQAWAIETMPTDAAAAQSYCEHGGAVVLAEPGDVAALEQAAAPVYAELEQDALTKGLIGKIRALAGSATVAAAPAPCGEAPAAAAAPAASAAVDDPSAINGVYRFEATDADLHGVGVDDQRTIDENHGVFTWTFENGEYCWEQRADNPLSNPDECGRYELAGDKITFIYSIGSRETLGFGLTADGDFELHAVATDDPVSRAWGMRPWKRIGDAG